jgi:hypothetical protein
MRFYLILFLTFSLTANCSISVFAQKSTIVGINPTFETTDELLRPGIGITAERRLSRHSGFESGLYYRNYVYSQYLTFESPVGAPGGPVTNAELIISERHLSIPLLYKYYSRIVNASIGPTFDFYVGWHQKNKIPMLTVNDYSVDPNFSLGAMIKISKTIPIHKRISLEPELRYNPTFSFERTYAGFGIAAKYNLP